jgi:hypothetical protein
MSSSAGCSSLALHTDDQKESSDDKPACLENPRPAGAESTLTENVASPFQAEPRQLTSRRCHLAANLLEVMSVDFSKLSVPQEIFTLFYAIAWGTAANSQPRWKAFAWGAFFQYPETRRRALLSIFILNALPLIYFILILWCLTSGKWSNGSPWTIMLSILPAFAPFGFYRMWTAW